LFGFILNQAFHLLNLLVAFSFSNHTKLKILNFIQKIINTINTGCHYSADKRNKEEPLFSLGKKMQFQLVKNSECFHKIYLRHFKGTMLAAY